MEQIYKTNISALKKYYPEIAEKIEDIKIPDSFSFIQTKTGKKSLQIKLNENESILLHSKYDPEKESENIINRFIKQEYDVLILGGFGLGFLCQVALKNKNIKNIIVIEKDLRIFKAALIANDVSDIIESDRIKILFEIDNEIPELSEHLLKIVTKKVFTLIHNPSAKIYPDFYFNLKNIIDSYLQRKNINIATLSRFQHLWVRNIFKNYRLFLEHKGIIHFFDRYKNLPVLVISAGPSLSDYIELIEKHQNRFIIVSVDSCFQVLVKNNIIPDFVITVDPQYINYKYFEYNQNFKPVLICEPSTFPLILKNYRGEIVFFSSVFPFVKWLENFTEKKGEIDMGGSVSTTAFDFAYKIGGNPLILVGQDLAFIKEKSHTRGSYVEKYWAVRYSKFNTSLNGVYKYIHNNLFIRIKSNNGSMVDTDKRLMVFHTWFENKMRNMPGNVEVINTSVEGAKIERMRVLSFDKVLAQFEFKDLSKIKEEIKTFDSKIEESKVEKSMKDFVEKACKVKQRIYQLLPLIQKAIEYSEELYECIKKHRKEKIQGILSSLDKIDKEINTHSDVTRFLSLLIQDKIHTILEEYEDYLTEEEKNNNDLKIAKRSILLYKGIKDSIEIFKKFFGLWGM